jgi:ABC-type lipoprotein export system ATPase subunit
VVVELSAHLNAVIGGRGTGKSTLLECLRYALEVSPKGKQASKLSQDIVKQNLGSSGTVAVKLRSAAQHGKTFTVSRRYGEPVFVIDSDGNTSQLRPRDLLPAIEFYGQNEIYELAQDSSSRLQLLERFLPADHDAARLREQLRKRLQENQQKLVKTLVDLDEVKGQVALLPKLTEQLQGYQSLGLETKLAKTPLLARERQLEERVRQELLRVEEALSTLGDSLPDSTFLSEKSLEGLPNREHLAPMRQVLENLRRVLEQRLAELKAVLQASTAETTTHVSAWRLALQADEDELRRAVAALPNMAGKTGREVGAAFQALSQQIERIKPLGARDLALTQLRTSLLQERANLRREQSEFRSARASALQHAVAALNKRLRGKLQVKLTAERDRGPLKTFLLGCRLDGIGERRLTWVDERDELTPLGLADAIREGQAKLMSQYSLPPGTAEALTRLSYTQLMELEALELEDIVDIELNVAHGENELYRSLERLSTGQQCTAVLHMLLLDNADPLVVDQPEDNLDNAFIAERIVRELRRAKTSRQFLFSTHNANIPVFGDAEWIGIFTADDQHGSLSRDQQGSIDVPAIRTQVADILEGGRAAFMQRKEKYEF